MYPQGSAPGPSLILYYINDIPVSLITIIQLFADDTIDYMAINTTKDAQHLQQNLYECCNIRRQMEMDVLTGIPTIKVKSINTKWPNTELQGSSPTDSEIHLVFQRLNWRSLENRRKDARIAMMYKIAYEIVAITKTDRLKSPLRESRNMHSAFFISPT